MLDSPQSILEKRKTQPSYMQFLTVKSQRGENTAQQNSINNFGTKKPSQLGWLKERRQLIRNQSQQSSPTLPSFMSRENHKTSIKPLGNMDSITIQPLGKQDSDKLEKLSRNSTPRENYRSRDKIRANALTNRFSTNSFHQNDLTTTESQQPVMKESLIEKSKFGIDRFKAWELGLDEKTFVAGSGSIDHKNLSINQKLSKKWDVKGELQKKRQEEEDKHDINFSAKIQLGIQYKEEKLKQQMEAIGGYIIKKQISKLDLLKRQNLKY